MTAMQARVDPRPVRPPTLSLVASANNVTEGGDNLLDEHVNDPVESESNAAGPRDIVARQDVPGGHPNADYEQPATGPEVHWIRGFSYRPETCNGGDIIAHDGGSVGTPPALEAQINVIPYVVEGIYKSTVAGQPTEGDFDEARKFARRQLLACESKQIERELWLGKLTDGTATGNAHLSDANVVLPEGAAPLGYLTALAALEQAINDGTCGQQGMIHARSDLISIWNAGGALRRVGNLILTIHDSIVVPGSGYDGSAPVAGHPGIDPNKAGKAPGLDSSWAYATTVVDLRRGNFYNPETTLERLETSHNTLTTYERRTAAATWGCLQVGVLADHTLSISTTGS